MAVKRPLDFRFPEWARAFTEGGSHEYQKPNGQTWVTALDFSGKRGTMYLRHQNTQGYNSKIFLRVTLDGVAYAIYNEVQGAAAYCYIFDFNESVLVEHSIDRNYKSRVEWAYYEYKP